MPEGDTLYRVARTLHKALSGQEVRRFDAVYTPLLRIDEEAPLVGRTVDRVEARGKWCLIWFSARKTDAPTNRWDGPLVLISHLRMSGMWHIYRTGEAWQRPAGDLRVLVATERFVAVGFRVPVAQLLNLDELARHEELGRLGPDLLSESFDEAEALRRLHARADVELGDALLDQSAIAGLGNVYKSEVCFLIGVDPFTRVKQVPEESLRKALHIGQRLLRENSRATSPGATVTFTGLRRTTAAMAPNERLWVYGRGGEACRRCQTPIVEARQGLNARVTFFCPRCQSKEPAQSEVVPTR